VLRRARFFLTNPTREETRHGCRRRPDRAQAKIKDLEADVEKWKGLSRKHEDRAKENATAAEELKTLKNASLSDQQKREAADKAAPTSWPSSRSASVSPTPVLCGQRWPLQRGYPPRRPSA
jgi:hypothetical protein